MGYQVTKYCYYRGLLSDSEKKAYDTLLSGLINRDSVITLYNILSSRLDVLYEYVIFDNPILFYVESLEYEIYHGLRRINVRPVYRFDNRKIDDTIRALNSVIMSVVSLCNNRSEYEKEILIHDYICKNVYYDTTYKKSSYECVGPLIFGKGVCQGISQASKLLFDAVGISSIVVKGDSSSEYNLGDNDTSHSWNIVKINTAFFHLDTTFDMSLSTNNVIRYDYFNLSDNDIKVDHSFDPNNYPICNTQGSYYYLNSMVFGDLNSFYSYLLKLLRTGSKDVVVQLSNGVKRNNITDELLKLADRAALLSNSRSKSIELFFNNSQNVFHLHFV